MATAARVGLCARENTRGTLGVGKICQDALPAFGTRVGGLVTAAVVPWRLGGMVAAAGAREY